jgi:hypothetical protein
MRPYISRCLGVKSEVKQKQLSVCAYCHSGPQGVVWNTVTLEIDTVGAGVRVRGI